MERIIFYIFYGLIWSISLLPLQILYILSDIGYYLIYHLIGYRRKVVRTNLKNSFPDKSDEELLRIEKKFYHHLCDYFFETMKLIHISDKEISKRLVFENMEEVNLPVESGRSVMLLMGHYGNWEWITSIGLHLSPVELAAEIYKTLKNPYFDRFFFRLRNRFKTLPISKQDTLRMIMENQRDNKRFVIGFIADQTPSINNIHTFVDFLHQKTAVFGGPEKIARKVGCKVVYFDVRKVKRGYYSIRIVPIAEDGKQTAPYEISQKYMQLMEQTIEREPGYWLWSHKRWKHQPSAQQR